MVAKVGCRIVLEVDSLEYGRYLLGIGHACMGATLERRHAHVPETSASEDDRHAELTTV